jgi:cardiolipin synthase A/B
MHTTVIILGIIHVAIVIFTIVRILLDTHSTPKTLGYLLIVILFPFIGVIFYYSFGINYRHLSSTNKGIMAQRELDIQLSNNLPDNTQNLLHERKETIGHFSPLVSFLENLAGDQLNENSFRLLVNGEEKFPEVLRTLETAKHFIHMEYYDWENDIRGNQIKEVLLRKVKEGVQVRVLYDDYASRKIRKNIVLELKNGGVKIYPKIKVGFVFVANKVNHRDHRKVIIVDGLIGFVGGINISDRYDNSIDTGLYWRDTSVKFTGPLAKSMQRHFIVSWNSCQDEKLGFTKDLFPEDSPIDKSDSAELGQIVAGGPIYPMSNIMLTYFKIFTLAKEKLYITNPYFLPSDSILDALKSASISGADVRLLMPKKSDSAIVGAASQFYYKELLQAGVKIYLYNKGFVHAKTVVADGFLSVVGTANMDIRSFDLNFEIMSVIYGENFGRQMEAAYLNDLKDCTELTFAEWSKIGKTKQLVISFARLISAFL